MRKIITQYCTAEQQHLIDFVRGHNQKYADQFGFEYVVDTVRRCPERQPNWEKIAWLRTLLPTLPDGSFVVWEDADSINVGGDDFQKAMPANGVFGMVQNRHGVDGIELLPWYNTGVITMVNCQTVRDFLDRVWARADPTDEKSVVKELRMHGWIVADGIPVSSLHPKWNCWRNNAHLCKDVVVRSFHGVKLENKLSAMQSYAATI